MRVRTYASILALLLGVALSSGCASKQPLNYGDSSPGNLWYQAYHTWKAGDRDQALQYADRLIELYGPEAREMQASLSDYPPNDPPEATYKYEALNAVGVALLIKGDVLMEKGDKSGSLEAFNTLLNDFEFGQYRDPELEWVRLGEVAKRRIAEQQDDPN